MELSEVHFFVLFVAYDGLPVGAVLSGIGRPVGSGEVVDLILPTPPEVARTVTLELFDAGALRLTRLDLESEEEPWLENTVARELLAGPTTWTPQAQLASLLELHLTPAGEALYDDAHREFGAATDARFADSKQKWKAFLERNPDFVERNADYLEALNLWLDRGGPEPKPPTFD